MSALADLEARLAARLYPLGVEPDVPPMSFSDVENAGRPFTPAAVLVPLVRRHEGWTMLLTQRTHTMPTHAGQISFPGGRVQPNDSDVVAAALRETLEETGLAAEFIQPVGVLAPFRTGTGYAISPIVACVSPGFSLSPDPREVDEVFETPLDFLMNPLNHERHQRELRGRMRSYYAITYGDKYIWGATAGMIRALYERLFDEALA